MKKTFSEIEELLSQEEGLAFLKGKWVEINHEKLDQLLKQYELAEAMASTNGLTLMEAMRMELNIGNKDLL